MQYLTVAEVVELHDDLISEYGGGAGVRDLGALASCMALPQDGFGDFEYYPTVAAKAAILCYSIAKNHPFWDANNSTAHAAMATFLDIHGYSVAASLDEWEAAILAIEANTLTQDQFGEWVEEHMAAGLAAMQRKLDSQGKPMSIYPAVNEMVPKLLRVCP